MKKYIMLAVAACFAFGSCDDALDSVNYTGANSGNFPHSPNDLNKQIAALYGVMNQYVTSPLETPYMTYNLMSDDCNGAGGTGDVEAHAVGHLMSNKDGLYDNAWHNTYVGIARANSIIYTEESVLASIEESTRNQLIGEAYFMRGLFYLWGSQFFGDIPAYWAPAAPDPCPQLSAKDEIYPHIIADFLTAYNLMQFGGTTLGDGHATKGTAAGFLARAYMFYEGFYNKVSDVSGSIPDITAPEGYAFASISKNDVVGALQATINSGFYTLVDDFRQLWTYTNDLTAPDYDYVKDLAANNQYWAGNGNSEQVFQIQFSNCASWNGTISMGFINQLSLYCSLRCDDDGAGNANGNSHTFPYAVGWGMGTINATLWDEWPDTDPRKKATILDAQDELEHFVFTTSCTEDAGYYNKKLVEITTAATADNDQTAGPYNFWSVIREAEGATQNNGNCMQGDHFTDLVLMRYADILLMESELTGTTASWNLVRKRARLPEVSGYNLEDMKKERRFEFAGEGLRFNDLRRWSGIDGGASCEAALALQKQEGSRVNYTGRWTTMRHFSTGWATRYAETNGFLPIPPTQIANIGDETVLKQNPGWGPSQADANMTGTPVY
ncbi:MAG: RagB/SusD family nutrient uptake outer membrane protein [Bacteroidales bacterium]|nr:RagB/SusD family nutrient uptake outer membrane protein [Bacteroidales bacterium]